MSKVREATWHIYERPSIYPANYKNTKFASFDIRKTPIEPPEILI